MYLLKIEHWTLKMQLFLKVSALGLKSWFDVSSWFCIQNMIKYVIRPLSCAWPKSGKLTGWKKRNKKSWLQPSRPQCLLWPHLDWRGCARAEKKHYWGISRDLIPCRSVVVHAGRHGRHVGGRERVEEGPEVFRWPGGEGVRRGWGGEIIILY